MYMSGRGDPNLRSIAIPITVFRGCSSHHYLGDAPLQSVPPSADSTQTQQEQHLASTSKKIYRDPKNLWLYGFFVGYPRTKSVEPYWDNIFIQ